MGTISQTYLFDSIAVATYIVAWANEHKVTINLTKTQKLLYIAYGAHLVLKEQRLCNEHPQAWPYGPVFPRTRKFLLQKDLLDFSFDMPELSEAKNDAYLKGLVAFVFKGFGEYTASQLTEWSHSPNSPWDLTTRLANFDWGEEIPDSYIQDYFSTIINRN